MDHELKDCECKCGPKVFPLFLRRWLSGKFNKSCMKHDENYEDKNSSRFINDRNFLLGMIASSGKDSDVILGIIYYTNVRIFGWLFKKK